MTKGEVTWEWNLCINLPFIHKISQCILFTVLFIWKISLLMPVLFIFWDPQSKARKSTTQTVPPPMAICLEEMDSVHLTIVVSLPQCRIWHNFFHNFSFFFGLYLKTYLLFSGARWTCLWLEPKRFYQFYTSYLVSTSC